MSARSCTHAGSVPIIKNATTHTRSYVKPVGLRCVCVCVCVWVGVVVRKQELPREQGGSPKQEVLLLASASPALVASVFGLHRSDCSPFPAPLPHAHTRMSFFGGLCSGREVFMAQYLKRAGYHTHAVGKWHLGKCDNRYEATYRGFDSYQGYLDGAQSYWHHVGDCKEPIAPLHSARPVGRYSRPSLRTRLRTAVPRTPPPPRPAMPRLPTAGRLLVFC